jgi:DNA-binding NarL/FixJ family response regulator
MTKVVKKLHILIADDHELVRHGIRALLQEHSGWKVVAEAADGTEAAEKARKLKPDLAILDIGMPQMDGLEAARLLRESAPKTRVLILTLHESEQMVRRVLETGARGYVLKSDLAAHLVKAVKNISRGIFYLTPKVSEIALEVLLKSADESMQGKRLQPQPTLRESQVMRLLAEGKSNKEIATALGIAVRTVETHRAKVMSKLGFHSLTELVHYAIRKKMVAI